MASVKLEMGKKRVLRKRSGRGQYLSNYNLIRRLMNIDRRELIDLNIYDILIIGITIEVLQDTFRCIYKHKTMVEWLK